MDGRPPIVRAVATEGQGMSETLRRNTIVSGRAGAKDRAVANWTLRLREMLRERLIEQFANIDFRARRRKWRRGGAIRKDNDGWINQPDRASSKLIIWASPFDRSTPRWVFIEKQLGFAVSLRETVQQEKVNVAMLPLVTRASNCWKRRSRIR